MAAGDIYVRRNSTETTTLPNAGTNLDVSWDNLVIDQGSIVSYTSPNLQLDTGLYLVMYSEKFDTTDTTNNERIEIQGEIHYDSNIVGYGQDYIRKSSGQQSCVVSGYAFVDITSDNTDLFIRFYRTDNSTSGTVNRVPGTGGVQIIQLDSTDTYAFYSNSGTQTITTTETTMTLDTNDRQDTGFSRSGSDITLSNAAQYLVHYEMDIAQTGTGRTGARAFVELDGTQVDGTQSACYVRGSDGCQDGALTWIGIVETTSASQVLTVRHDRVSGSDNTIQTGTAKLQMWRLDGTHTARMEATTGNWNSDGMFDFDTLPQIDTSSFTATAGNSNIDVDQSDYVLAFATCSQRAVSSVTRAYPELRIAVNEVNQAYAAGGYYHRNSGGAGAEAAATVAGVFQVNPNNSVELDIQPAAASGSLANTGGQLALISLESLFGPYAFPPSISDFDGDNAFIWGQENIVITGANFEALQGTGKVEIWDDESGTTKTVQTIDSWSDTSIQIDSVQGSLLNDTVVYVVVTTDSGIENTPFPVSVGLTNYKNVILDLSPDHYWSLDNDFLDTGITGPTRNMDVAVTGSTSFATNPISEDTTHTWHINSVTARREITDSVNMNITNNLQQRTMGGWIQLNTIQKSISCLYKEGGGVNNLAFYVALGNVLTAALADTGDDNVQAYSDFRLTASRPYHIMFKYDYTVALQEFRLYVDGRLQSVTDGNPLTSGGDHLDAHSGDVIWGDPDTNLEVGGTDINFAGPEDCYYNHWCTWSENSANTGALPDADILELFQRGALPDDTITADTEANMQTDIDATADARPDWPLSYRIEGPSTGGPDLELTLTDKVFDSGITEHIEWRGTGTLTLVKSGTTNLDSTKTFAPNGGTIVVAEDVAVDVTVLDIDDNSAIQNARVYLTADSGGPLTDGDVILTGVTDVNGQLSGTLRYSADQPVDGRVRKSSAATFYKTQPISSTITQNGLDLTVFMTKDE